MKHDRKGLLGIYAGRGSREDLLSLINEEDFSNEELSRAMIWSVNNFKTENARTLLDFINIDESPYESLVASSYLGRDDLVERLIEKTNPKDGDSMPLLLSVLQRHGACVKLLFPVSDVEHVKNILEGDYSKTDSVLFLQSVIDETNIRKNIPSMSKRTTKGI